MILCGDDELGYVANRTHFVGGQRLALDDTYRLAHLPLVAPDHPKVIARREGKSYDMGRHERVTSLVVPVPGDVLQASPAMQQLEAELEASPIAHKIAWHILEQRHDRLHATLAAAPTLGAVGREALARLGPVTVELRGLFSGNVNLGRLYLRAYPEKREEVNVFHRVQEILGCHRTNLYVVGLYNLIDDLDVAETAALAGLIERWWDKPLLRFRADMLWLLNSADDLVLDANLVEAISLR